MKRKDFLWQLSALAGALPFAAGCSGKQKMIPGKLLGATASVGHLLRDKTFNAAADKVCEYDTVIIGAGISGLAAAHTLAKKGHPNFVVLDLEEQHGGNAISGKNAVSAHPWGAHYVPLPNNDLKEYLEFLKECGVVTGYDQNGLPVYNEYHLCFEPEERLYINGSWQQGLIPSSGLNEEDRAQIERFLLEMDKFRKAKGNDGKDAFAIPVNASSKDERFTSLDTITLSNWLSQEKFTSKYLLWYCDYCCRDDFGSESENTSAWAGIHYFAARKGVAANAKQQDVLTWPEGNGFLANQLFSAIGNRFIPGKLAVKITEISSGVEILTIDATTGKKAIYRCRKCIAAIPQFVLSRMLNDLERTALVQQYFSYTPWLVANITTAKPEERSGESMCWDNVIYGGKSLGYVNACHQHIGIPAQPEKTILTWYRPFSAGSPMENRKKLHALPEEELKRMVIEDLSAVHPNLEDVAENIDLMIWGHGMVRPTPGFIHSGIREKLAAPLREKIFFAHTDLAGISIFEEGFYQGFHAAKSLISTL